MFQGSTTPPRAAIVYPREMYQTSPVVYRSSLSKDTRQDKMAAGANQRRTEVRTRHKETTIVSPKCARCKNHGVICPLKGHKGLCKWKDCTCKYCSLIVERQRIMAAEQSVLKEMAEHRRESRQNSLDSQPSPSSSIPCENKSTLNDSMAGVKEYLCLHFGSDEARTTMAELEKWSQDKDPQPCYINILRRLFPDIKPKVLQLLLAACDSDLIKTVETILPCCKKMKTNGQITYLKATVSPTKMTMLSRTQKFPTRLLDKRDMLRYTPYPVGRTYGRFPSIFVPPYAHAPIPTNDNCGLCIPSFIPPYYISKGSPEDVLPRSRAGYPYYTMPKYNFAECKTVTSSPAVEMQDTRTTTAAATLISLSNS